MNGKRKNEELSKDERKRIENFNKEKDALLKEGYKEHDLTININTALIVGTLIAIIPIVILVLIYFLFGNSFTAKISEPQKILLFFINMLVGTVVHESVHGITFATFSKNHFKDIRFGIIWKALTPYCSCNKPLKKHQYLLSMLMPFIVLGVITSIVAITINSFILLISGAFQIFCAGGDLLIAVNIIKNPSNKKETLYFDHPTECGVVFFDK